MTTTAEAAGLDLEAISHLQQAYAHFLITFATQCWIEKLAACRILQQKLIEPGGNIWLYLRNHLDEIPLAFQQQWNLQAGPLKLHIHSIAAVRLKSLFCTMFETREPWSILYDR